MGWLLLLPLLIYTGCTNVNKMYQQYQDGDEVQFERIMEIVSLSDYPYATRRKAAQILGNWRPACRARIARRVARLRAADHT